MADIKVRIPTVYIRMRSKKSAISSAMRDAMQNCAFRSLTVWGALHPSDASAPSVFRLVWCRSGSGGKEFLKFGLKYRGAHSANDAIAVKGAF